MAITKYSDISAFVNTIFERSLFVVREMNLMSNLVSGYSAKGWMTREFSIRPTVTPVTVADGVDYNSPTTHGKSSVGTLTPAEVIAQIMLTDQDVETDPDGARNDASMELGMAVAQKIDTDLLALFTNFTTDKGPGAGNSTTLADLASAVAVLRNRKAYGTVSAVLHPYQWHDVWVEMGRPAATYANVGDTLTTKALQDYFVDRLIGLNIYISANIETDGSDDAIGGVFVPDALALDTRRPYRLEPERDASLRAWELNATVGYAVGFGKRPTFGVKFTGDVTEPT